MNSTVLYFDIVSYASLLCIFICTCVFFMLVLYAYAIKGVSEVKSENAKLELVWTIVPTIWVYILCYCNVGIVIDEIEADVDRSVKVIGRQWYWSYNFEGEEYDSFMASLVNNVDNPLVVAFGVPTRLLVTASDVIHSFSVPDLGVKVDAVPGRINQVIVTPNRVGSFVGYCSEICGTGHSYMPIVVEVIND
uniref:cytochrome c oxidase subunit II n=1 Tax=Cichlidogyrus halli TaxID=321991 RepID=UPI00315DFAA9